ncbi:hypothetical protein [Neptuniibacter marinus]|uniref:hypothetical protein n=1 Tax=Neptuniibacter marinus TaxID=1806670 RepID=UPI000A7EA3E5|nr:hypothetical protein [Neptuniibacter marinus]
MDKRYSGKQGMLTREILARYKSIINERFNGTFDVGVLVMNILSRAFTDRSQYY